MTRSIACLKSNTPLEGSLPNKDLLLVTELVAEAMLSNHLSVCRILRIILARCVVHHNLPRESTFPTFHSLLLAASFCRRPVRQLGNVSQHLDRFHYALWPDAVLLRLSPHSFKSSLMNSIATNSAATCKVYRFRVRLVAPERHCAACRRTAGPLACHSAPDADKDCLSVLARIS